MMSQNNDFAGMSQGKYLTPVHLENLLFELRELQKELATYKDSYASEYTEGIVSAKNSAGDDLGEILKKYGVD